MSGRMSRCKAKQSAIAYTDVSPKLFDVLRDEKFSTFKVVALVFRQTAGWESPQGVRDEHGRFPRKVSDAIARSQFMDKMGMAQASVQDGISTAISKGYVERIREHEDGKNKPASVYRVGPALDYVPPNECGTTPTAVSIPNWFFDCLLPNCTQAVAKIVGALLLNEYGLLERKNARQHSSGLSISDIEQCMLMHRETVTNGLEAVQATGYVKCFTKSGHPLYRLVAKHIPKRVETPKARKRTARINIPFDEGESIGKLAPQKEPTREFSSKSLLESNTPTVPNLRYPIQLIDSRSQVYTQGAVPYGNTYASRMDERCNDFETEVGVWYQIDRQADVLLRHLETLAEETQGFTLQDWRTWDFTLKYMLYRNRYTTEQLRELLGKYVRAGFPLHNPLAFRALCTSFSTRALDKLIARRTGVSMEMEGDDNVV